MISVNIQKYVRSAYMLTTALYTSASIHIEIILNLCLEFSIVQKWLRANKLTLNVAKTKYIVFGHGVLICSYYTHWQGC